MRIETGSRSSICHSQLTGHKSRRPLQVDPEYDYKTDDPMSFNPYSYVRENPIMGTDPTGMVSRARERFIENTDGVNGWDSQDDSSDSESKQQPQQQPKQKQKDMIVQFKSTLKKMFEDAKCGLSKHEEAAFIVKNYKTGEVKIIRWPRTKLDTKAKVKMKNIKIPKGFVVIGQIHTHPMKKNGANMSPSPIGMDLQLVQKGIPVYTLHRKGVFKMSPGTLNKTGPVQKIFGADWWKEDQ
ncbi:MAG: hypothetical protein GXO69_08135 [Acidobacteria bacterium]|nr:hypothetical protein [Acidobacteriota bacterium]